MHAMHGPTPRAVLGVIPARYGASRFPGKPLATLWGKPMIQHVWERAAEIGGLDALVIATDDDRIAEASRRFGAEVAMTSPECASGTDRVAEVARSRPQAAIIVNLQGDEPELDASGVDRMIGTMRAHSEVRMATLAHREHHESTFQSTQVVKLEVDGDGNALYFTRRWPPARRAGGEVLRHIGVYGFQRDFLLEFASWPPSASEKSERLEQLRALDHGVPIRVEMSDRPAIGVDTPEELAALERRGPQT